MYTDTDDHRRENDKMSGMIAEWKQKRKIVIVMINRKQEKGMT